MVKTDTVYKQICLKLAQKQLSSKNILFNEQITDIHSIKKFPLTFWGKSCQKWKTAKKMENIIILKANIGTPLKTWNFYL